jgi:hypothetical protein
MREDKLASYDIRIKDSQLGGKFEGKKYRRIKESYYCGTTFASSDSHNRLTVISIISYLFYFYSDSQQRQLKSFWASWFSFGTSANGGIRNDSTKKDKARNNAPTNFGGPSVSRQIPSETQTQTEEILRDEAESDDACSITSTESELEADEMSKNLAPVTPSRPASTAKSSPGSDVTDAASDISSEYTPLLPTEGTGISHRKTAFSLAKGGFSS